MNVLIFRTYSWSQSQIVKLNGLLNKLDKIINWTIDMDDIDNVLRIETSADIEEEDILDLLNSNNLMCEILSDEIIFI